MAHRSPNAAAAGRSGHLHDNTCALSGSQNLAVCIQQDAQMNATSWKQHCATEPQASEFACST